MNCAKCNKELSSDEIALHKRLIGIENTEFLCIECIAEYFDCDIDILKKKIQHFKNMGCTLFFENQ